jgi:hypothetical protein
MTSAIWQHDRDTERPLRTWSVMASDVLLEQVYEQPGIHHFAVRRLRRALSELLEETIPASARSSREEEGDAHRADEESVASLPEGLDQLTQVRVLRVDSSTVAEPEVHFQQIDLALVTDGQSRCVMLAPETESTTTMLNVSRKDVHRHISRLLTEPYSESRDPRVGAV